MISLIVLVISLVCTLVVPLFVFLKPSFKADEKKTVYIADPERLRRKKEKMRRDGPRSIQVVSDFDHTFSKFAKQGERLPSSYTLMNCVFAADSEFNKRSNELMAKYYPMEISSTLSADEKAKAMTEWWNESHRNYYDNKLTLKQIREACRKTPIILRGGVKGFVGLMKTKSIPITFVSAALNVPVQQAFTDNDINYHRMHLICNEMEFDEDGVLLPISEDPIHTDPKRVERLRRRKNVMLLGDNIGDLKMTNGFDYEEQLSIGFLNDKIEERLDQYMKKYDVVLVGDQDFTWVNQLMNEILE